MESRTNQGGATVAKVQKTIMVHEDLYRVIEAIEAKSGASFPRIVTAALLQHVLQTFANPEVDQPHGPESTWMNAAVLLERGEVSVADLPGQLLRESVQGRERWINALTNEDQPNEELIATLRKELKGVKRVEKVWLAHVEEFGGQTEALIDAINNPKLTM